MHEETNLRLRLSCIFHAGLACINYFETAFPEVTKFGTNNGHPEMLHNKAEWIVALTTKVILQTLQRPDMIACIHFPLHLLPAKRICADNYVILC